jgi:hypothetical protein
MRIDADDAQNAYIHALKELFTNTKGLIIKVPAALEAFRSAQPDNAPKALELMVAKGLIYPTTYQRTQIRGDIDSIYNELSRADRWGLNDNLPADFNPLWGELCALSNN